MTEMICKICDRLVDEDNKLVFGVSCKDGNCPEVKVTVDVKVKKNRKIKHESQKIKSVISGSETPKSA